MSGSSRLGPERRDGEQARNCLLECLVGFEVSLVRTCNATVVPADVYIIHSPPILPKRQRYAMPKRQFPSSHFMLVSPPVLLLLLITTVLSLLPPSQPPQHPILLPQRPHLRNQRRLPSTLHLQRLPCILGHPPQSRLPLRVLEPQLHAGCALGVQQALVVLVQRENGGRLRVRVRTQFVEQQGEGVFVVGDERGEGCVVGGERCDVGVLGGDAGLEG